MADLIVLHGGGLPRSRKDEHGKIVIEVEIEEEIGVCHHHQAVFSHKNRTCKCRDCGADIDVFELLLKMHRYCKKQSQRLKDLREVQARERERIHNGWTEREQKRAEQRRKRTHFRRKRDGTWHATSNLKQRVVEAKCSAALMRRECEWSEHRPTGPLCVECFGGTQ